MFTAFTQGPRLWITFLLLLVVSFFPLLLVFLTKQWQEEKIVIFPVDIYRRLNESLVTGLYSVEAQNSLHSWCALYHKRKPFPMTW